MSSCDVIPDDKVAARLQWRAGARIELVAGYTVNDATGNPVQAVSDVSVAIEGGFVHVDVTGVAEVQVLSAPAIRRIAYR